MKTLNFRFIIAILFTLMIWSCKDNDKTTVNELKVSSTKVTMMSKGSYSVQINDGNGGYTIKSNNPGIIKAEINDNLITFSPISKGKTTAILKDQLGEQLSIECEVTDCYLSFFIKMTLAGLTFTDENHKPSNETEILQEMLKENALPEGCVFELCGNTERTMVVFSDINKARAGEILHKGTYSIDSDKPILTLKFNGTENSYKLSTSHVINAIYTFLDCEKKFDIPSTYYSPPTPVYQYLSQDKTDVYKIKYPEANIQNAHLRIPTAIYSIRYSK